MTPQEDGRSEKEFTLSDLRKYRVYQETTPEVQQKLEEMWQNEASRALLGSMLSVSDVVLIRMDEEDGAEFVLKHPERPARESRDLHFPTPDFANYQHVIVRRKNASMIIGAHTRHNR